VSPATHQTRAHVIELSQLDLQLAFVGTCALGEDVENQPGAIQHATLEHALEVTFLTGREDMIENDQVGLVGLDLVTQLFHLAATDEELRGGPAIGHTEERHGIGTGGQCQFLKLLGILARLGVLTIQMNQDGPFTPFMALEEQCDPLG